MVDKVLIIGAGAVGLTTAQVLTENPTTSVTFVVRQEKVEDARGQEFKLYNYDKKSVVTLSNYEVVGTEDLAQAAASGSEEFKDYSIVFITLHGDSLQAGSGKEVVSNLSKCLNKDAIYVIVSVGFQVYEKAFKPFGIPQKNVLFVLPNFLAHEVGMEGQPDSKNFPGRDSTKIAFHFLQARSQMFMIEDQGFLFISSASKKLRRVMRKKKTNAGTLSLPKGIMQMATAIVLSSYLMLDLQQYPKKLKLKDKNFDVAVAALHDVFGIYGFSGMMMKLFVGKRVVRFVESFNRKAAKPLGIEFVKYHHGLKVKDQNVNYFKNFIQYGTENNTKVSGLKAFVDILEGK